MNDGPRILIYDIETSPHKCWSFNTYKAYIGPDQVIEPSRMICWAAKWYQEPRVLFRSEYHDDTETMLAELNRLLHEADAVVTYNGDKFDKKHAAREFHLAGLPEPSPYVSIDLYKIVSKNEIWASKKLAFVSKQLGLSGKLEHEGFRLWRAALGDFGPEEQRKAWAIMRRYCKRDVVVTEEMLVEYLPFVTNLPSASLWGEQQEQGLLICPNPLCGSDHITRQGYKRTKTRRYPRYHCEDCGKWFSETHSDRGSNTT